MGLVNAVFPEDEFDARAEEWIGRLARHSASTLRLTKAAFKRGQPDDFEADLNEIEQLYLDELMTTHDANEGLTSFIEKRKPDWKGK